MTIKECINTLELYSSRVGIRILPSLRVKKYMEGKDMYFSKTNYRDCQIGCVYAKNDAIVFVITETEAIKHGLIKEE